MGLSRNMEIKEQQNINTNKKLNLTKYILQGGPDIYRGGASPSASHWRPRGTPTAPRQLAPTVSKNYKLICIVLKKPKNETI